ncbi:hypothetical protein POM88_039395 [Heracleum sosnowskyi]|uniref:Phosphoglycerate mutase n=1 Tax=Heracleum sosnowskyi TaxID=360622 RepID=A0AAD8HB51_9APIA|nr:hypothetical protein POM88_039395 [Heracleum sosnowskyi]
MKLRKTGIANYYYWSLVYYLEAKRQTQKRRTHGRPVGSWCCNTFYSQGSEESINEINQRCASCLQRIGDKHRGERIVVVTHGGVMRAFFKRVYPRERTKRVWSSSVSVLHLSDGDEWKIIVWGDASHI